VIYLNQLYKVMLSGSGTSSSVLLCRVSTSGVSLWVCYVGVMFINISLLEADS